MLIFFYLVIKLSWHEFGVWQINLILQVNLINFRLTHYYYYFFLIIKLSVSQIGNYVSNHFHHGTLLFLTIEEYSH
jgi:hypothetical protein